MQAMKHGPSARSRTVLPELSRHRQLLATEWIEELTPPTIDLGSWLEFRRLLEALPQDTGWPHSIAWPTPPGRRRPLS
jgi:hypothetical protein